MQSRFIVILLLFCFALGLTGQQYINEYRTRDSLINDAMKSESYDFAIGLIEQQIDLIQKNQLTDSLYHYCYSYGRATWKVKGPEKGIEAALRLSDEVKADDPDILHYLQTLNDLSWLYYETGNVKQCLLIDSTYLAICLENDNIPTDKLNLAYYNMGFDYLEVGKNLMALDHFQSSIDVIVNSDEQLDKSLSRSYNALGAVQWHLGMLEEAKESYKASLTLIEKETDPESRLEQGNILGNMALILQDNGEIIKAKEMQERFIQIDTDALPLIEDPYLTETAYRRMSSAYINLADIYFGLGDYEKSRKLVELAISERQRLLEPDDPSLASAIEHLAYLELQSGNYLEAEKKLKDYLKYCQKYFGEVSAKTSWAYKDLGLLHLKLKDFNKSEEFFNKAIQSQKLVGDPDVDPYLAKIYHNRSSLYVETRRADEALSDLNKSLQIYSRSRDHDNNVIVGIYLDMAEIYIKKNNTKKADSLTINALELTHDKESLSTQAPYLLPNIYYLKALAKVRSNANALTLETAMNDLESAIQFLKSNKQSFLDEESKIMLYDAHKKVFEFAEDLAYSLYLETRDEKWINTFFRLTEENRTILLRSRLQNFSALDFAGVPDSILRKERKLASKLRNEGEDLQDMKNVVDLERQYNALIQYIQEHYPEYYALKYFDKTYSIKDVQSNLVSNDNSLLIYSLTNDYVYALLIDHESAQISRLPKNDLTNDIKKLNEALVKGNLNMINSFTTSLYNSLVAPLRSSIKQHELIIVPDEELFFLNFEILPDLEIDENKLLIHSYTISYHLSTTVALQFSGLNENSSGNLLTFAPGFTDRQKLNYRASVSDSAQLDDKFLTYIQQPFAVETAKNIAGIFQGASFVEENADETTFKNESGKYGIIHLGTHAEINHNSPLMSHLVLSKNVKKDSLDDGYLHAYEIYQMPLQAELAVLTACETGVGKQQNSEGVISLAHSFTYAGCPSIVMSLWRIDEKTSSGIINDFYHYLAAGMKKNEALRQAKLDYLDRVPEELQSPYYWAGLVLLGDQSPVEIKSGNNWFWISFFSVALLILIVFILIQKRS